MFTGLIEEVGTIKAVRHVGRGKRITVHADKIMDDLKVDDSVAMNGVCQTVVSRTADTFEVEAVEETLRKTTLSKFNAGKKINLERAVKLSDRMGGHLVQGHVDCTGHVLSVMPESTGKLVWISFPVQYRKYVVGLGSICVDGVSLTVAKVEAEKFMISVIPHSWDLTIMKELKGGSEVNLEFDIIGKYVENMVNPNLKGSSGSGLEKYIEQGL